MNPQVFEVLEASRSRGSARFNKDSICSYQVLYEQGGKVKVYEHLNDVCYARFRVEEEVRGSKVPLVAINYPHYNKEDMKDTKAFYDYLMKRSPFKDVFITKDVDLSFERGMLIDLHQPTNIILGGMTLGRTCREYPYFLQGWLELVEKGVPENAAVVLSHSYKKEEDGTWVLRSLDNNHSAFDVNIRQEASYDAYVEGKPVFSSLPFVDKKRNTLGDIQRAFVSQEVSFSLHSLIKTDAVRKKTGWGDGRKESCFSSTDAFVSAWKVWQGLEKKKPKPKEAPKKGKEALPYILRQIRMEKGFTLAEVRKIRKELRDMPLEYVRGELRWDYLEAEDISSAFVWDHTPQGHFYWEIIHKGILQGAGYDAK